MLASRARYTPYVDPHLSSRQQGLALQISGRSINYNAIEVPVSTYSINLEMFIPTIRATIPLKMSAMARPLRFAIPPSELLELLELHEFPRNHITNEPDMLKTSDGTLNLYPNASKLTCRTPNPLIPTINNQCGPFR